jgi:hypothetical protein
MIGSIIELVFGWFIVFKAPRILKAKGIQATIIKLIGWLLIIASIVDFIRHLLLI